MTSYSDLQTVINDLRSQITNIHNENIMIRSQITNLQNEHILLRNQNTILQSQNGNIISSLREEIENLKRQIEERTNRELETYREDERRRRNSVENELRILTYEQARLDGQRQLENRR